MFQNRKENGCFCILERICVSAGYKNGRVGKECVHISMCVNRHVGWWFFQKSVDLSGVIHEKYHDKITYTEKSPGVCAK